jgi:pyruvate/2-oxoglutarate dehydrogenase complex dihydrolipoamide dehydrogenase (E3) component
MRDLDLIVIGSGPAGEKGAAGKHSGVKGFLGGS